LNYHESNGAHVRRVEMIEIIPIKCINILPLSAEPLASWNDNCDLRMLLMEMYALGDHSSYGEHRFEEGRHGWWTTAYTFQKNADNALPAPAAEKQAEPVPIFYTDINFGLMAKYFIA